MKTARAIVLLRRFAGMALFVGACTTERSGSAGPRPGDAASDAADVGHADARSDGAALDAGSATDLDARFEVDAHDAALAQDNGNEAGLADGSATAPRWTTPVRVENSDLDVSHAVFALDRQGNTFALWQSLDAELGSAVWVRRYDISMGWGQPERLSERASGGAHVEAIEVDDEGNAFALWYDWTYAGPGTTTVYRAWIARYDVGRGWESSTSLEPILEDDVSLMLAVNGAGDAVVAANDRIARYARSGGFRESELSADLTLSGSSAALAIDGRGAGMVLGFGPDPTTGRTAVRSASFDRDGGWATPETLPETDDSLLGLTLAAGERGAFFALYTRYEAFRAFTWMNVHVAGQGWGTPMLVSQHQVLSPTNDPSPSKLTETVSC